jgi:hypothetical protein
MRIMSNIEAKSAKLHGSSRVDDRLSSGLKAYTFHTAEALS